VNVAPSIIGVSTMVRSTVEQELKMTATPMQPKATAGEKARRWESQRNRPASRLGFWLSFDPSMSVFIRGENRLEALANGVTASSKAGITRPQRRKDRADASSPFAARYGQTRSARI
jgi:hypothetical protein